MKEMPERIYLFDCNDAMMTPLEGDTEYIRKDIVDDMIKTGKVHAFFVSAARYLCVPASSVSGKADKATADEQHFKETSRRPAGQDSTDSHLYSFSTSRCQYQQSAAIS